MWTLDQMNHINAVVEEFFAEVPLDVDSLGTAKGFHLHKVPAEFSHWVHAQICITSTYICK